MELLGIPPTQTQAEEDTELKNFALPEPIQRPWKYEIKIVHDESIAKSKDSGKRYWDEKGHTHRILPKSEGVGIMVSAFCSPHFGWLSYSDEAWKRALEQHPHWATDEEKHRHAYEVFEYGKAKRGYWTALHFVRQVDRSIDIFEATYPDARGVYYVDCSSGHKAFAADALLATKMNVNPGG